MLYNFVTCDHEQLELAERHFPSPPIHCGGGFSNHASKQHTTSSATIFHPYIDSCHQSNVDPILTKAVVVILCYIIQNAKTLLNAFFKTWASWNDGNGTWPPTTFDGLATGVSWLPTIGRWKLIDGGWLAMERSQKGNQSINEKKGSLTTGAVPRVRALDHGGGGLWPQGSRSEVW